jgi:hypothetical protein
MASRDRSNNDRSTRLVVHLAQALVEAIEDAVSKGQAESVDAFVDQAATAQIDEMRREDRRQEHRAALLATPVLTVPELARRRGESLETTERWMVPLRMSGRLIALPDQPDLIIPAFQVTDQGTLITVVAETNRILTISRVHTLWTRWAWWHSRTGYLSGESPINLIHTDPHRIITAVRRDTDPHG